MATLSIRDLEVSYAGGVRAVRGVDLEVAAGESVGIAGESGCGKSTVALSALRLLPKSATVKGSIEIDGEDVLTMRWGRLRAVRWAGASIVFQGALHSLNPVRTVGEQIAEPILLHRHGERPSRAQKRQALAEAVELLSQVGLPVWRSDSYPHELSGGQKQRVMIAMALACEPDVIIADEPTTALDVVIQAGILRTLKGLVADRGLALVVISHDLAVLAATCDRVAVMYAGRIVESGPGGEIFRTADHPYTQGLSAAFPVIGDPSSRYAPRGLAGDPPDLAALPPGCAFAERCPRADEVCRTDDPALAGSSVGRQVACWHPGRSDQGSEFAIGGRA
jgi:peptide/nickel transport system ATP-binding protein